MDSASWWAARSDDILPGMGALKVLREGHVLQVRLNRPELKNAFDEALIGEVT